MARPAFEALHTSEGDFRQIASDINDDEKKRIYVRFGENTALYMAGCYNGHSVDIAPNPQAVPITHPGVFSHATNAESAATILREGIRNMSRQQIHLVPLHMKVRQEAYIRPGPKKTHIVTVDGTVASAAGIKFYELENGAVVSYGINGIIPPCCIAGLFSNTKMGRRCLDMQKSQGATPCFQTDDGNPGSRPTSARARIQKI